MDANVFPAFGNQCLHEAILHPHYRSKKIKQNKTLTHILAIKSIFFILGIVLLLVVSYCFVHDLRCLKIDQVSD